MDNKKFFVDDIKKILRKFRDCIRLFVPTQDFPLVESHSTFLFLLRYTFLLTEKYGLAAKTDMH